MTDRLYNAQIDYPFAYHADADGVSGLLDCLFYMSPEDTFLTPAVVPAGIELVGAWLFSREKIGNDWEYVFYAAAPADPDTYAMDDAYTDDGRVYVRRTFLVTGTPVGAIVSVRATEDSRSVLTANNGQITGSGTYYELADSNYLEPAVVVPCTRKVTQVNLYNEFRASNPGQRNELPPDYLQAALLPGENLEFNDGYNCNVFYNETTQTLRFTGGLGFGVGRPNVNEWDDTSEDADAGVRDVNGVNTQGIVEVEAGASVEINASILGELHILVRDQGDLVCPPE